MQPSGEVGRIEVDDQPSPPADRHRYPNEEVKAFCNITPSDFQRHPVWEFANDIEDVEDVYLRPVDKLPIDSLGNRIVGTTGTLAIGNRIPIILQNIALDNAFKTEHFVTLTAFNDSGDVFPLARYHDLQIDTHGPEQLAAFLGLKVSDVFPISYDISEVATGVHGAVCMKIAASPKRPLSESEIIDLVIG